jgi:hypothetical protein
MRTKQIDEYLGLHGFRAKSGLYNMHIFEHFPQFKFSFQILAYASCFILHASHYHTINARDLFSIS